MKQRATISMTAGRGVVVVPVRRIWFCKRFFVKFVDLSIWLADFFFKFYDFAPEMVVLF